MSISGGWERGASQGRSDLPRGQRHQFPEACCWADASMYTSCHRSQEVVYFFIFMKTFSKY